MNSSKMGASCRQSLELLASHTLHQQRQPLLLRQILLALQPAALTCSSAALTCLLASSSTAELSPENSPSAAPLSTAPTFSFSTAMNLRMGPSSAALALLSLPATSPMVPSYVTARWRASFSANWLWSTAGGGTQIADEAVAPLLADLQYLVHARAHKGEDGRHQRDALRYRAQHVEHLGGAGRVHLNDAPDMAELARKASLKHYCTSS
jgi:hypothetical protein